MTRLCREDSRIAIAQGENSQAVDNTQHVLTPAHVCSYITTSIRKDSEHPQTVLFHEQCGIMVPSSVRCSRYMFLAEYHASRSLER